MEPLLPDALKPIVNLAKARELLDREASSHMPKGAKAQRDKMIATLGTVISNALAVIMERLPEKPEGLDDVSKAAWDFVVQKQAQPATPTVPTSAYANLQRVFDERSNLSQAGGVVEWIKSTHVYRNLPDAVIDDATSAVEIFMHRCMTQPAVKQWIEEVRANPDALDETDRRNFALMERQWMESAGLNEKLVDDLSRAETASFRIWEEAKPKSDFEAWLPDFSKVVELKRQEGEALSAVFNVSPYQALLENYNPGLRNETVNNVFSELRAKLPTLIDSVIKKQAAEPLPIPLPAVPVDTQLRVARQVMKKLGLDDNQARLDTSEHPFSCGQWDDVRITTRYREDDMMPALMGIIHETGHALYSLGLPKQWKDQPIGDPQSMWVHETQSLFWEMQVASSKEFMEFLSKIIKEELEKDKLKVDGPEWSPENLYKLVTRVKRDFIRVDADEVTYPAHVILRHDLEQKLIDGTLAPKDVPAKWAEGMRDLLGVDVPDHAQGCMQDVHWADGSIGYFPAYTFGALGAAQLMEKAKEDMPDIWENIKQGNVVPIREWLAEKIHKHGSYYSGEELMKEATGKPLSAESWLKHIEERYLDTKWQDKAPRAARGNERVAF